ncbi:DUF2637 domain-containing protein [Streptomyces sp. NPDC096057]|uniref:DUF2637 domain-containing protein n=1 Tax=Streptomyces sp. NPDC096057 TaxID=3155543 RepID=UPI0033168BFC
MRLTARLRRIDLILVQAVIAAALSFSHIHDIADAAGQHGWKAWAYPISVDLLMVMAWRKKQIPGAPQFGPWCWFLLSLAASVGANIGTSGILDEEALPTWLRVIVAGWPVVAFLGGSMLVHSRKAPVERPQEAAEEPAEETAEEEVPEPAKAPQVPRLVTYREAADIVGVAPETVRGAANGPRPRLIKYPNPHNPGRICVDLNEVRQIDWRPVAP